MYIFEVKAEKTMYMLLSRHQNTGQNRDIKIAIRSFENVAQFQYLGTAVKNQNLIHNQCLEQPVLVIETRYALRLAHIM
jgi:hypothetical protein